MARNPPTPEHLRWLKANGHDLAPLTGTDRLALAAIDACWHLYASDGDDSTKEAIVFLVARMQFKTRELARELIARAMDWEDRDRHWPEIEAAVAVMEQANREASVRLAAFYDRVARGDRS